MTDLSPSLQQLGDALHAATTIDLAPRGSAGADRAAGGARWSRS